jgi:hypothetical protein
MLYLITKRLVLGTSNAALGCFKATLEHFRATLEYFRAAFAHFNAVFGFLNIVSHVRHEANEQCPPACDRKVATALAFCCKTDQAMTSIKQELQETSIGFQHPY